MIKTNQWKMEGFITLTMSEPMKIMEIRRRWWGKMEVRLVIPAITDDVGQWFQVGDTIALAFPGYFNGGK